MTVGRVVLVAHGSRREGAETPLHAIAEALVEGGVCAVADVVARPFSGRRGVVDGAADVVVPMFLVLGDDSRAILAETWPGAVITEPIGKHPLIAAVVVARAIEAAPAAKGPVVVVGHGSSRAPALRAPSPPNPLSRFAGEGAKTSGVVFDDRPFPEEGGAQRARRFTPRPRSGREAGGEGAQTGEALAETGDPLTQLVDEVRRRLPARDVSVAFLEAQSPSIPEALDALDGPDDSDVVVVPAFFLHGQHTVVDIPALLVGRRRHAVLALPFLAHPLLIDAVKDRVAAAAPTLDR